MFSVPSFVLCTVLFASRIFAANLQTLTLMGSASLPENASYPLNPALGSFSVETAFFVEFIGNASSPNNLSLSLLQNLKDRTGTAAQIRIGGITADSTYWNSSLDVALFNTIDNTGALLNTTIGPLFWDAVKLLPEGTKIIMTLDLRNLNYDGALSVAESAVKGLNPSQLIAFELGNEPDQYAVSFTIQSYSSIWELWSKNMSSTLGFKKPEFQLGATVIDPLWPYNAPGATSQLDCVSALSSGADAAHTAISCSEHTYQYSVCDPTRAAVATLPNLVNHTRLAQYLDLWQPRIHGVRSQLGPDSFVIGEYNSVSCSGKNGVSNTFGQALWLLDTTFYAASINVSRLYIHQGGPLALQSSVQLNHGGLSFYDLWYPIENQNGGIQVFPSYSAYLFIAETLGQSTSLQVANIYPGRQANGSTITTAGGDSSAGQLVVYGFWDKNTKTSSLFPTKLALLNLEIFNQTQTIPRPVVTVDISAFLPTPKTVATVRRLQAPGADVQQGNLTTWAGQSFASGIGTGELLEEKVVGGKIQVEASGAALVFLSI